MPHQHIRAITMLGHICPQLRVLSLQANRISRLENLHRLKVRPCVLAPYVLAPLGILHKNHTDAKPAAAAVAPDLLDVADGNLALMAGKHIHGSLGAIL